MKQLRKAEKRTVLDVGTSQDDYFDKKQRYEIFIEKMSQLQKSEEKLAKQRKKAL